MKLIFDIETTGIPGKGLKWEEDYKDFPHLVQMAWVITDEGKELDQENHIIYPNGWEMPQEAFEIHGITQGEAVDDGVDEKTVLKAFLFDAQRCDTIIGHNIYFDTSIIKANLLNLGFVSEQFNEILHKDKRYDTMMKGQKITGGRWPKLAALHQSLFNEDFEDAHTAMGDVRATMRCYFEMIK